MGSTYSFSFTFDPNIAIAIQFMVFLLLGLFIICFGVHVYFHGAPISQVNWQKQLLSWRIIDQLNPLPNVMDDVKRCWGLLFGLALLGAGIALVLVLVGNAIITFSTTGSLLASSVLHGYPLLALIYLGFSLGSGAGSIVGVWRLRHATTRGITYSELHRRSLSDYRLTLLRWIPVALLVILVAETALLGQHLGPMLQLNLLGGTDISLPNSFFVLGALPGAMLLTLFVSEYLLMRLALLPRLLVTADLTLARRADDMLRSAVIGLVQFCELAVIGTLGLAQQFMLMQNLVARHGAYDALLTGVYVFAVAVQSLGILIPALRGRLGGRVTGWPWQGQVPQ